MGGKHHGGRRPLGETPTIIVAFAATQGMIDWADRQASARKINRSQYIRQLIEQEKAST